MGAGAVGGYFGCVLANQGEDVIMIARGRHGTAISDDGLTIDSHWGNFTVQTGVTDDPSTVGNVDLILHCTKLYSNSEAVPALREMVGDKTTILTIQNGVTSGSIIAGHYGLNRVVSTHMITLLHRHFLTHELAPERCGAEWSGAEFRGA